jgi:hypothetical protein
VPEASRNQHRRQTEPHSPLKMISSIIKYHHSSLITTCAISVLAEKIKCQFLFSIKIHLFFSKTELLQDLGHLKSTTGERADFMITFRHHIFPHKATG